MLKLGQGPPLVLVHGGLGEATNWAQIMPILAARFRVYAVDRPGHGLADPFDYAGVDLLRHGVRFLDDVLDALRLTEAPLVANSMGARWAIEYALRHPDRVSRLVLVGVPAGTKREVPREFYEVPKLLRMLHRPILGAIVRSAMRRPSGRERARQGLAAMVAHPERLDNEFVDSGTFNFLRNSRSMLTLLERAIDEEGLRPELVVGGHWAELSMPTTLIWGDGDIFDTVEHGGDIAGRIPHGRFVPVRDAGHLPWLDEPDLVATEVLNALSG